MTKPHLLIIDGHNLVRTIHGANPAPESEAKAAGVIKSSRGSFHRALREHAPTHCLWTFDVPGLNWRHELYPAYKAGRKPMPEELRQAMVSFKSELAIQGWAMAEYPGFEAEDVIASASLWALSLGAKVTALSTDKDVASLGAHGVVVHNHFARVAHDQAWCEKKFGIQLVQLLDYLALWGDSVDGVPGVDGVGAKTAAKLLTTYGTLEDVLAAAAEGAIPGSVGSKLVEQTAVARLSRKLTDLRFDVFTAAGHILNLDELAAGHLLADR